MAPLSSSSSAFSYSSLKAAANRRRLWSAMDDNPIITGGFITCTLLMVVSLVVGCERLAVYLRQKGEYIGVGDYNAAVARWEATARSNAYGGGDSGGGGGVPVMMEEWLPASFSINANIFNSSLPAPTAGSPLAMANVSYRFTPPEAEKVGAESCEVVNLFPSLASSSSSAAAADGGGAIAIDPSSLTPNGNLIFATPQPPAGTPSTRAPILNASYTVRQLNTATGLLESVHFWTIFPTFVNLVFALPCTYDGCPKSLMEDICRDGWNGEYKGNGCAMQSEHCGDCLYTRYLTEVCVALPAPSSRFHKDEPAGKMIIVDSSKGIGVGTTLPTNVEPCTWPFSSTANGDGFTADNSLVPNSAPWYGSLTPRTTFTATARRADDPFIAFQRAAAGSRDGFRTVGNSDEGQLNKVLAVMGWTCFGMLMVVEVGFVACLRSAYKDTSFEAAFAEVRVEEARRRRWRERAGKKGNAADNDADAAAGSSSSADPPSHYHHKHSNAVASSSTFASNSTPSSVYSIIDSEGGLPLMSPSSSPSSFSSAEGERMAMMVVVDGAHDQHGGGITRGGSGSGYGGVSMDTLDGP